MFRKLTGRQLMKIQEQPLPVEEPVLVVTKPVVTKPVIDEIQVPSQTTEIPVETPSTPETPVEIPKIPSTPTTPKEKYLHLLDFANKHVTDLRRRCQFQSAEWLEQQIIKITGQFSSQPEGDKSIKAATESLENALDCTVENMNFLDQLLALPEDSPSEEILRKLVVKDIRAALDRFSKNFDARMKDVFNLVKDSDECAWHQTLKDFYETTKSRTDELHNQHDIFNSRIPGFQTAMHWVNPLTDNINPLMSLETLGRNELATHKVLVEEHCAKALYFLENETKVERILDFKKQYLQLTSIIPAILRQLEQKGQYLQLAKLENAKNKQEIIIRKASTSLSSASASNHLAYVLAMAVEVLQKEFDDMEKSPVTDPFEQLEGLKQLSSPYYETLHEQIVGKAKESLDSYIKALSSYQNTLSIYIPILEEKKRTC